MDYFLDPGSVALDHKLLMFLLAAAFPRDEITFGPGWCSDNPGFEPDLRVLISKNLSFTKDPREDLGAFFKRIIGAFGAAFTKRECALLVVGVLSNLLDGRTGAREVAIEARISESLKRKRLEVAE